MAKPYLSQLQSIVERLYMLQSDREVIFCKHFFSGAAAYFDGRIFMSLSPVGLALKLPEKDCITLLENGATPLRYFSKSPAKKGYAVLPEKITADDKVLKSWIDRSIIYAGK